MPINYSHKINARLIGQSIINEPHTIGIVGVDTVALGIVRLIEVPQSPSPSSTISIPGFTEIFAGSPIGTQFLVTYSTGVITFNLSQNGNSISVSYIGLGSEIAAEDINELQEPVGIALNIDGSLTNNSVKPASISNTVTDVFNIPNIIVPGTNQFATPLIVEQPLFIGPYTGEIDFKQNGVHQGNITKYFYGGGGGLHWPDGAIAIDAGFGLGSLWVGSSGSVAVSPANRGVQTNTTFYVDGNMMVGLALEGLGPSLAPSGSLYVQNSILATDFVSNTINPAGTGQVKLAKSDTIDWRDNANGADLPLAIDGSDNLTFNGHVISTSGAGPVTSITGTTNQVIASSSVGAITLSLPQDINTTSGVTFASIEVNRTALNINGPAIRIDDNAQNSYSLQLNSDNIAANSVSQYFTLSNSVIGVISSQSNSIYIGAGNGSIGLNLNIDNGLQTIEFRNVLSASNITHKFHTSGNSGQYTWENANNRFNFSNDIILSSSNSLSFTDNATDTVSIKASNGTTTYSINLPTSQGAPNTALQNDGSGNLSWAYANSPISTKTSNYPITTADKVILANGAITITLPTAIGITGQTFIVKNITASSVVVVNTTSSQTIDGQLTQILNSKSSMEVASDGNNWFIL